jgi:hypothetical protein
LLDGIVEQKQTGKPQSQINLKLEGMVDSDNGWFIQYNSGDHPSSACPLTLLQAHLALESTSCSRLILRWIRVKIDIFAERMLESSFITETGLSWVCRDTKRGKVKRERK